MSQSANIREVEGVTIVDFQNARQNENYCEDVTVEFNDQKNSVIITGANVGWVHVMDYEGGRWMDKEDKPRVREEYYEEYIPSWYERPIGEMFKKEPVRRLKSGWVQLHPKPVNIVTTNFKIIY